MTSHNKFLIAAGLIFLVIFIAIIATFFIKPSVAPGDTISAYYTGTFDNGTVFAERTTGDPVNITVGSAGSLPGLDLALTGMTIGEEKTVFIPVVLAYGERTPLLVHMYNRVGALANATYVVGEYYAIHRPNETAETMVKVTNVTPDSVTWDENNPLAGENLTFKIKVVGIMKNRGTAAGSPY